MDINQAFPSRYLKAADLQGKTVAVTIDRCLYEDIGSDEQKPVVYFVNKEKGLVLNKTNANTIAEQHGFETNDWHGKAISLWPTQTDFQGRVVACIRVLLQQPAAPAPAAQPAPKPEPSPQEQQFEAQTPVDSEIPF
jgi:hypothetical protein